MRPQAIADAMRLGTRAAAKLHGIAAATMIEWCKAEGISIRAYKRKQRETTCPTCKKPFLRRTPVEGTYCSTRCYGFSRRNPEFARDYRGDNWWKARKECIARYQGRCATCPSKGTDVHHIFPYVCFNGDWQAANHQSNLILLCRLCHHRAERIARFTLRAMDVVTKNQVQYDNMPLCQCCPK